MAILNYTTTIDPHKTSGEVAAILARYRVQAIQTTYRDGEPSGLAFVVETAHGLRQFRLPVNVEGVEAALRADPQVPAKSKNRAQARRVAWRILKDWIEAQMALIDAGMSQIDEVLLPYMISQDNQTVSELYQARSGYLELEDHTRDAEGRR